MYIGNSPQQTIRTDYTFIAIASQTLFTGIDSRGLVLSFNPNNYDVYANGILLARDEYIGTDGSTVTFITPRNLNDIITIRNYGNGDLYDLTNLIAYNRIPVGTIIDVYGNGSTPIPGYLLCNGAAVTNSYPDLRAFGLANGWPIDGNGDPLLPNTGGRVKRAWLPGQVIDSGRVFGTLQNDQMQQITGEFGDIRDTGVVVTGAFSKGTGRSISGTGTAGSTSLLFNSSNSPGARVGSETRMHNYTVTQWIKAYNVTQTDTTGMDLAEIANDISAVQAEVTALKTEILHVRHQNMTGNNGGASVVGNQKRVLNTVVTNGITGASLSDNEITLPAGIYDIEFTCAAYRSARSVAWLRTAGSSDLLIAGRPTYMLTSADAATPPASGRGRVTFATTKSIELAQYFETAHASGWGIAANVTGLPEIHAEVFVRKVD